MSFNTFARKVLDPKFPFKSRRAAFGSCLVRFRRPKESFRHAYWRYSQRFGFDEDTPDAGVRLNRAMNALNKERNLFLDRLRLFEKKRIKEKMRGRRTPSKAAIEALYTFD
jgi:hypothetical protein